MKIKELNVKITKCNETITEEDVKIIQKNASNPEFNACLGNLIIRLLKLTKEESCDIFEFISNYMKLTHDYAETERRKISESKKK